MLFLGIDSSTMVGSIALLDDSRLVGEYTLNLKRTHSERLMVAIEHLMKTSGLAPCDLGAICVAVGPGSYTGVRIGVTTAKALAWTLDKPLVAVGTLEALAKAIPFAAAGVVAAPCIAAKSDLVFAAAYDAFDGRALIEPSAIDVNEFVDRLKMLQLETGARVVGLGDGYIEHSKCFIDVLGEGSLLGIPDNQRLPRASFVADLGREKMARGEVSSPVSLAPTYLRVPEAELAFARRSHCCAGGGIADA